MRELDGEKVEEQAYISASMCTVEEVFNVWFTKNPNFEFLDGLQAHYHVISNEDKDKMINKDRMEKWVLRKSFENYLPDSVAWRQKEQFSDGVGYDWIDSELVTQGAA